MVRDYRNFTGAKNPNYKHGLKSGEEKGIYNSWQNMKSRCLSPSHPKYERYGGRGIKICPNWLNIDGFYEWAKKSGWFPGATIDRIDNDGDYTPENCRWISVSENSRKKSTTKISFDDAKIIRERAASGECPYKIANEYGVVHGTVWFIINNFTHVDEMECIKKLKERLNGRFSQTD